MLDVRTRQEINIRLGNTSASATSEEASHNAAS
jgi:hypothetical protein